MFNRTQKDILQLLNTLLNFQKSIININTKEELNECLIKCQEAAISVGNEIEKNDSDLKYIVSELEQYCEIIYSISQTDSYAEIEKYFKLINDIVNSVIKQIKEVKVKYRVVFLPYKADMWDSLESIWVEFAKDNRFDCKVVAIPYFDANRQTGQWEPRYDALRFPKNVPIVPFEEYNLGEMQPDLAFIHNPFDKYNLVTSVHPDYYTVELKKYIKHLVYVPYYVNSGFISDQYKQLPALLRCDSIVVQSKSAKKSCEKERFFDKVIALGSPKFDKLINSKDKVSVPEEWIQKSADKKKIMLNTTISDLLGFEGNDKSLINKLRNLFDIVSQRKDVVIIWRPHPLLEATIKSLRVELIEDYNALINEFISCDYGIYDKTGDVSNTIIYSDAYIGSDYSSVINMFEVLGKPIYLLNSNIIYDNSKGSLPADKAFSKPSVYAYFAARESEEYAINNFLDDLVNDNLENVTEKEIVESRNLAENLDGTCGEKIYRYFSEKLIKEEI
ncbi:CDP-Glycerol:Poly(glycerophosphate) glycerophosphotransferase [[Lactobacillus] rogosae]|nr:CDP-glycerol:poly(glycerophosphate) glycerophosphotransferase [Bacteroides galacturonicus]CUQ77797.1 Uncharacterised protein [Lachnospira pectinoschiza]SFE77773.1 CDP-Glycerol:Poly(glycerophosphate) glycerophosphotransferase [Lactobacillus rogosae]